MRILGKVIGWFILIIVILYLIAAAILHFAIKPEQYKSFVENTVYKYTGHKMQINGTLEWSVFPNPSIKITKVLLKNDAGQDSISPYFAKVEEANLKLSLMPLFSGQIEPSKVIIRDAHLNLIYQSPKHNPIPQKPTIQKAHKDKHKLENDNTSQLTHFQHITLPKVLITRSNINWIDLKDNHITNFKNINLFVNPTLSGANIKGSLAVSHHQDKASFAFASQIKFSNNRTEIKFRDVSFKGDYKNSSQHNTFSVDADADMNFNSQKASLRYKAHWNRLGMHGGCLLQFNQVPNGLDIKYQAITKLTGGSVDERGTYHLVDSGMDYFDYLLTIKDVDVAPVMQVLHYGDKLQGKLNISAKLNGNNKNHQWIPNLNGRGAFSLKQAQLGQLSAVTYLDQALTNIHRKPVSNQDGGVTIFSNIRGTFQLQNGVLINQDLDMQAPRIFGSGSGTINFVSKQINYLLKLWHKSADDIKVPLIISGSISNPKVTADYANLGVQVIQKTIKKKVFKNIFNGKHFKFDNIF